MLERERILDARYLLVREIHSGRRCRVYQATHLHTHRTVAVKLLKSEHLNVQAERDSLIGEARLLSEIRHVAIPDVLDAGLAPSETGGLEEPYIVMEMIEGRSLAGLLAARGQLDVPVAIVAAQALAAALRACHLVDLVHQDVRPANILLPLERADRTPETRGAPLKLVDFDTAMRSLLAGGASEDRPYHPYLAPEQQHGGTVDPRTDVFATGVVLYECLTGRLPYPTDGSFMPLPRPPSEHRDGVSPRLDDVVMRALAPNVTARLKDMNLLLGMLEGALAPEPSVPPVASVPPPTSIPTASLVSAPTMPPAASRRRHPRAAYMTPVRLMRDDGTVIDCTSEDISESGMLLYGRRLLGDEERIRIRFALPIGGAIVQAKGVARWHREAHGDEGATGVSFVDLAEAHAAEIAKYVEFFSDPG